MKKKKKDCELPFLDLLLKRKTKKNEFEIYRKKTCIYTYIIKNSNHF